jgi:hypothetical protein
MPRLACSVAALLVVALTSCAGVPHGGEDRCRLAFQRADGLLRAGLAEYVDKMKAFTAARDPQLRTAGAEARAQERAEAWTATRREPAVKECRDWPEERLVCVLEAKHAAELGPCGLDALVQSFTDEVVEDYAARPFDIAK